MVHHGIRHFRTACGMTQLEVAERLGYTRSVVGEYEAGRRIPPLYALQMLARLFHTTIDALVYYEPPDPTPTLAP